MCWSDHIISDRIRIEGRERESVSFGLVERFDFKLKGMLQKVMNIDSASENGLFPSLFLTVQKVLREATGFCPIEILKGR